MRTLHYQFPASRTPARRVHVGVVGSGDLEVLVEPSEGDNAHVRIRTSVEGFEPTWRAVLDRFFTAYDGAAEIQINDAGATPGVVSLRLAQAVEASEQ